VREARPPIARGRRRRSAHRTHRDPRCASRPLASPTPTSTSSTCVARSARRSECHRTRTSLTSASRVRSSYSAVACERPRWRRSLASTTKRSSPATSAASSAPHQRVTAGSRDHHSRWRSRGRRRFTSQRPQDSRDVSASCSREVRDLSR
jgi:hypothetical protein